MSINALYRRHIANNEIDKGLLQALLVLGDKIEVITGTHPDAAIADVDPITGELILNANDYREYGNLTSTGDLIEELINRLDDIGGGGGGGGSTPPEILRSATDLSGTVPAGYTYGFNYNNGKLFIKNASNQWFLIYDPTVSDSVVDGVNSTVETILGATAVNVLVSLDNADPDAGVETLDLDNNAETDDHPSNLTVRNGSNISLIHGLKASIFDGKIVILHNANDIFPLLLVGKSELTNFAPFNLEEDYPVLPRATVMLVFREGKWSPINGEAAWSTTPVFTTQVIHDFLTVNNSDKLTFFVAAGGSNFLRTGTPGLQGVLVHRVTNINDRSAAVAGTFGFGAGSNNLMVGGAGSLLKFSALIAYEDLNDVDQEFVHNIGFMRNANQAPVNGIYFRYSNANASIECVCAAASTETVVSSGFVPVANAFLFLKILVYPDGSKVLFSINNEVKATITTNIPVGGGNEFTYGSSVHKINGSTNRDTLVDFMEFKALTNRRY